MRSDQMKLSIPALPALAALEAQLKLTLKGESFANLGVLTGNDWEVLGMIAPSASDFKAYAKNAALGEMVQGKLDKLKDYVDTKMISAAHRSGFTIDPNYESPSAVKGYDRSGNAVVPAGQGSLSITAPNGKTYSFQSQEQLDAFKKAAGL